jgi:exopolysaccharide production protein ExoZ
LDFCIGNVRAKAKLDGLQAGRAVAALLVVAFHANIFILPDRLYRGEAASRAFDMGYAGVEFFFVLSGFIMFYVHAKGFSRPDRASHFLRRRIVRIYPIYWIVFGALTALYFIAPDRGTENARDPEMILTSLLLVPTPELPIMRVAWTLRHEMLFYLVFVLVILNLRLGTIVFGLWMVLCLVAASLGWTGFPWDFFLSAYNVLFMLGIGAAMVYSRIPADRARGLLVLGVAIFLFTELSESFGLLEWDKALRTWAYGVGAAMVTTALAAGALSPLRWLTFLGDASYSIYLVHLPAMIFLAILLGKAGAPWDLPPILSLLGMIVLSSLVGGCTYAFVERPVLKRLSSPPRPAVQPPQGT